MSKIMVGKLETELKTWIRVTGLQAVGLQGTEILLQSTKILLQGTVIYCKARKMRCIVWMQKDAENSYLTCPRTTKMKESLKIE